MQVSIEFILISTFKKNPAHFCGNYLFWYQESYHKNKKGITEILG